MAEVFHSEVSVGSRHPIHGISEFADEAEREAYTYTDTDEGKVVRQVDDNSYWLIKSVTGGEADFVELGGGGAGSSLSERYAAPDVPHALDEEFVDTSLSNFVLYDSSGIAIGGQPADTNIDPYTNDTTNSHAVANTYKRSWLSFKCRNNNSRHFYMKGVTLPTNCLIWTRFGQKVRAVQDAATVGLMICAATAGHPDTANRVEIRLENTASGRRFMCQVVTGGSSTAVFTGGGTAGDTTMPNYLMLHKLGTTWYFYVGNESSWVYLGSGTQASTHVYAGFVFHVNDATPGSGINDIDFLRFVESATYLP